jgi:hypothetical protein
VTQNRYLKRLIARTPNHLVTAAKYRALAARSRSTVAQEALLKLAFDHDECAKLLLRANGA